MLKMGFWEANCLCEILLPHFWSITCILGIVRTLKGLHRWKTTVGPIRWRKLWSQEVGTEKMWGLIWSCGLNPSPSLQNKGTTMKLIFPYPSAKHVSMVLPLHACTCTCICLYANKTKVIITRRLSAVPAERTVYLCDKYKSRHLKCCWNMLIFFQQEPSYRRCWN